MKRILLILCSVISFTAFAQIQDPNSPGFDLGGTPADSAVTTDPFADPNAEPEVKEAPVVVKPYERIKLEVDSVTNLILYTGVVEQEESSSDSLYIRTKKWAVKQFGAKPVYEVDKKNQKLTIAGFIPAFLYTSKYAKKDIGRFNFKMTIWYKEGRYKYAITNLVHEGVKGNTGIAARNYFEYYYTTTTNIKGVDQILRAADKDLLKMVEGFKKAMKDPVVVDEEEW